MVAEYSESGAGKGHGASDAEDEHHDEEEDGKKLRDHLEPGQSFGIGNESEACTTANHLRYVCGAHFVG